MADFDGEALTLEQIRFLTKHENTDAIRMALRRAGVRSCGVTLPFGGPGSWPPRKTYSAPEVWNLFAGRILQNAAADVEVKGACWSVFAREIRTAAVGHDARTVYADHLFSRD